MGEVYKARDTRLDRIVAIKVAHQRFSERFEREARTVSALNHPHICQLYDVGPDYLVMEYIEGKPVSGPMPVTAALRLASQIAEALDAAHTKGFVHRDLKPDNILVTKSGVKLLDFGLAKLAAKSSTAPEDETVTQSLTREGTIVGTLPYMAPEQLQGQDADARSDIFAFGAVLYEMLTGRRAFAGDNQASIIAAIMSADPPAAGAPQPALDRALRRCLAKDPDARWQSVRDLGEELKWIAEEGGSQSGVAAPEPVRSSRNARVAWSVAGALAIALAVTGTLSQKREPAEVVRLQIDRRSAVSDRSRIPTLSPDGSKVAFLGVDEKAVFQRTAGAGVGLHIWVRPISSFQAQMIPGTEEASSLFWSPDGKQIAFEAHGRLQKVELAGGAPQPVCEAPSDGLMGTWSPSGVILLGATGALRQVSAQGGDPKPATSLDVSRGEMSHRWPHFLPDGRHFLYLALSARSENSALYVASLDSPQTTRVMASGLAAVFAEPGYLLYVRAGTLVAHPFDWKSARLIGDPVSLSEQVFAPTSPSFYNVSSFSVSGATLAYRPGGLPTLQLTWFDRQGKRLSNVGGSAHFTGPALAPDGQRVLVGKSDPQTTLRDIWALDWRGSAQRLTFDPKDDFNPVWSPDGTRMAFSSDRKGVRDIYVKQTNGTGGEDLLVGSASHKNVEDWSPDGKFIIYNADGFVWAVPVQGDRKPFRVVEGPADYDQGKISPDGKWIAYRSPESGRQEVYVQSFPVATAKRQISTAGGGEPSWRGDGKELYFTIDNKLMAVNVKATAGGFEHTDPKLLFEAPFTSEVRRNRYAPAADGQKFLIVMMVEDSESSPINIVLNWKAALKR
jgi:serine/threonine protein kinase